ncbi:serine hydrolase domain-containing protein [Paenibacillus guangzhouensis]|uniref:serine hydrolase domain-containing protein n=1 Tax=Paenibacillus guangzhouensis TaxID=1473112 RepID=UPI001266A397|nr:serine hydrolase domain-containing protein [Paenibacillus guangzhouensis]
MKEQEEERMMQKYQHIIDQLDSLLNDYIEKDRAAAGIAVGIVYDHQPIYAKGFGVKNIETGEPVDGNTLFHMASVSKTYVATAIMQLVEQGKIALDEMIMTYLPYFSLQDERYRDITVRHLLSHTSGMPDEEDYEWDRPQYDEEALERYVRQVSNLQLMWEPERGQYAYSNIAFEILGDVIAKVSGMSFEQYMKEHILMPLGMNHSSFFKPEVDYEQLATPHMLGMASHFGAKVSPVFPYNRAHGPSSTLLTSAAESCAYAMAYLNGGSVNEATILQPSSVEQVWQATAPADDYLYYQRIGLGWFMGHYKGNVAKAHGGMDTGFRSNLVLLPEKGIAVTIMFNTDYLGLHSVNNAILDVLLGEQVQVIPRSFTMHVAGILAKQGMEAALQEHCSGTDQRFTLGYVSSDEDYSYRYIAHHLFHNDEPEHAMKVLELAIQLDPEASDLRELRKQWLNPSSNAGK